MRGCTDKTRRNRGSLKQRPYKRKRCRSKRRMAGGKHNNTIVVYELTEGAGFFSTFWIMCKYYLYAKKHNYPFFVETTDSWQYKYKLGWHDYFKTLKEFNKDEHTPDTQIKKYNRSNMHGEQDFSIREYKDEAVKEIFVLNDNLQKIIDEHVSRYGKYKSLYIRRGDKGQEAVVLSIGEILEQVQFKDDGSSIYVQTDDYTVVEEIRKLFPSCKVHTHTPSHYRGAHYDDIIKKSDEDKKLHAEELLISVGIFLGCVEGWTDPFSNVGVFHKLAAYDKVKFYVLPEVSEESVHAQFKMDAVVEPFLIARKYTANNKT